MKVKYDGNTGTDHSSVTKKNLHTPPRKPTCNPLPAMFVINKTQLTIAVPPEQNMGFANFVISIKMPDFAAFA